MNKQYGDDSSALETTLQVGKSGIGSVVDEMRTQFKKRKLIKVKFLKTAFIEGDRRELARKLAELTGSELVEVRGNTAVYRRKG